MKVVHANGEPLLHPAADHSLAYLPGCTVRFTGRSDAMGVKSVGLHWHTSLTGALDDARRLVRAGRIAPDVALAIARVAACESAAVASDSTPEFVAVSGVHGLELTPVAL